MAITFDKDEQSLITLPNGQYMCRNVDGATLTAWVQIGQSTFSHIDIGTSTAGAYWVTDTVHNVKGNGSDIWGTSDEFRFVYFAITGDATITAQVLSLANTAAHAKAGVMMRQTLTGPSPTFETIVKPVNTSLIANEYRASSGASMIGVNSINSPLPDNPCWVRVTRVGDLFSSYYSLDGATWTQIGTSQTIVMGSAIYAGLCVSSHASGTLTKAQFDNVTLTNQSTSQERWVVFISNGTTATSARAAMSLYTTGVFRAAGRCQDSEGATVVNSVTVPIPGQTYFVAARFGYQTGALDLFVNGQLEATTTNAAWIQASSDTEPMAAGIGTRGGGASGYWDGTIDDVRIYHTALPDYVINNLYLACGKDRTIGYVRWKLREGGSDDFARTDIKDVWAAASNGATDTFIDTYPTYADSFIVSGCPRLG